MKKITIRILIVMLLMCTYIGIAQTLNQAANWPNAGWTLSGTHSAGGLLSNPTVAGTTLTWDDDASGNGSFDNIIVTSPVIDLTAASMAGETWITITSAYTYWPLSNDILIIETYDADAMTWSTLFTFAGNSTVNDYQTCANTATYTTPIIDISGFTTTQLAGFQYRISYDDQDNWNWGWCITSPTITSVTPPTCIDPSALTATNITDTTADLGWTENNVTPATIWDIEIINNGTAATGTPTATGVTNPYNATGLTADTLYDFYVRADCGAVDGTSNWIGPFTFRTDCTHNVAPFTEDFETFTPITDTAFTVENCWTGSNTGNYYWEAAPGTDEGSPETGPASSITTGNYFYTEATGSTAGDVATLASSPTDLSGLTAPALMFNYHMYGTDIGTLEVLINGTDNVWSLNGQQHTSATDPWKLTVVNLAAYADQTITITFRATSAGAFRGDIAIDNVTFGELPPCPSPILLTATNITGTTADLGWTENGAATTWDVEIVTSGTAATGTPTATGIINPYTAMNLTAETAYDFYVRADCGVDGTSDWTGPFTFSTGLACPDPSALTATNITGTTADLGWTENGSASAWDIEIVASGTTVTGTPTATGVTNPYTAMNLTAETAYDFYVRADCGVDGTSGWAGPFTFSTVCTIIVAPHTEDFETFTPAATAFVAENCWTASNTGANYFWEAAPGTDVGSPNTGPDPSITTGNYFYTEASNSSVGNIAELVSPPTDLSGLTTPSLTFDYHMYGGQIGTLDVLINGTDTVWSLSGQQQSAAADPWESVIINLAAYAGQTITVTFRATGAGSFEGDIAIDNVAFAEFPTCPDPITLTATNVTETTANLGWTESGTATAWDIEIITSGTAPTGTPTAIGVTNPYNATGLTGNTLYDFYVRADCGMVDGTSNWVGPFTFRTACVSITAPYIEDFESFTTADVAFTNENCWTGTGGSYFWEAAPGTDTGSADTGPDPTVNTGNYFYTEASAGSVGDTTDLISPLIDLSGLTAPSLTFNYHMYGVDIGTLDVLVNGIDNVWTLSGQQQASATTQWELAIIDLSSYAGQTISVTFRGTSAGVFEGDIAIDNVAFTEYPTCLYPTLLTATNITITSADLSWTENNATPATMWDVEIITSGTTPTGTPTATGVTNPYNATGLTSNTTYDFYVRANCGVTDGTSTWSGPYTFTTDCDPFTAPYTQDFENGGTVPACWNFGGDEDWLFTNTGAGNHIGNNGMITGSTTSGGYFAYVDDSTPDAANAQLNSPFVDVSGLTTPSLSFYQLSHNEGNANATLTVSVWDGAVWNVMETYNTNTLGGWIYRIIDLSGLTFTGPARARFSVADSGSFYDDIAIDDVTFDELPPCPSRIYVTSTGTADDTGVDWANATSLQNALSIANICTTAVEIWVAQGTYTPGTNRIDAFTLPANISMYGGFTGSESMLYERNYTANPTILSGDIDTAGTNDSYTVVHLLNSNTIVDGFIIENGNANATGSGIYDRFGAGIYMSDAANNNNITNCIIRNNNGVSGIGFANFATGTVTITNTLFHGNTATHSGAAIGAEGGTTNLINCTIANNTIDVGGEGGGALRIFNGSFDAVNTIFAANGPDALDAIFSQPGGGLGTLTYSFCAFDVSYPNAGTDNGSSFENTDPLFADAANDDYTLQSGSLLIDVGNNASITGITGDLAYNDRIFNTIVDLGVYEFGSPTLSVNENSLSSSINIYPNPASDIVHISTDSNVSITKIELYDFLGKRVLLSENTNKIHVAQFDSGVYILKLYVGKQVVTHRIVVE